MTTSRKAAFGQRRCWWSVILVLVISTLVGSICVASSVTYQYDNAGRLTIVTYSDGTTTTYTLDAPGNRKQVSITPLAPGAPGVPSVTSITTSAATVSWTAASGPVTNYEYSVDSATFTGAFKSVGTALTVNLTALTSGASY